MCSTPGNIIQLIVFAILMYIVVYIIILHWCLVLDNYSCLYLLLHIAFLQGLLKNRDSFTDEMMEAYVYTFSQPGALTAALNYYRCMFKNLKNMKRSSKLLEMPILVIWVSIVYM